LFSEIVLSVISKCKYLFSCRLEFKNLMLKEIFGGEIKKWTGGWRKLKWALGEWDLWWM
jgi:hypothetical protein